MLELAERLDAMWENTSDAIWFAQGRPELENWRVALDWTLHARGDRRVGQRIAGALDVLPARLTSFGCNTQKLRAGIGFARVGGA